MECERKYLKDFESVFFSKESGPTEQEYESFRNQWAPFIASMTNEGYLIHRMEVCMFGRQVYEQLRKKYSE